VLAGAVGICGTMLVLPSLNQGSPASKKYSKTKPYVALYPLKAVITRPADIMAVIKTLVNAPGISNVVIL